MSGATKNGEGTITRADKLEEMAEKGFLGAQRSWGPDDQTLRLKVKAVEDDKAEKFFEAQRQELRQMPPRWLREPQLEVEQRSGENKIHEDEEEDAAEAAAIPTKLLSIPPQKAKKRKSPPNIDLEYEEEEGEEPSWEAEKLFMQQAQGQRRASKGGKGDKGAKGFKGGKGAKGDKGEEGGKGAIGAKGAKGTKGAKGSKGAKAPKEPKAAKALQEERTLKAFAIIAENTDIEQRIVGTKRCLSLTPVNLAEYRFKIRSESRLRH